MSVFISIFFFNQLGKSHYHVEPQQKYFYSRNFLTLLKLNLVIFISAVGKCRFKQILRTHTGTAFRSYKHTHTLMPANPHTMRKQP